MEEHAQLTEVLISVPVLRDIPVQIVKKLLALPNPVSMVVHVQLMDRLIFVPARRDTLVQTVKSLRAIPILVKIMVLVP